MKSARELEELLVADWSTGLRLTTVPQAMERLGMADEPDVRWRVASRLEELWRGVLLSLQKAREILNSLGRAMDETESGFFQRWQSQVVDWQLASILLTEEEKLMARHILQRHREGQPFPRPGETGGALHISTREVSRSLRMLARLGFLDISDGRRPAEYSPAQGHEGFLNGLGFSFHTVTLDTGERFGIP